jgi:hypothetical protein
MLDGAVQVVLVDVVEHSKHFVERPGEQFGLTDGAGEGHRSAASGWLSEAKSNPFCIAARTLCESVPAADDLDGIIELDLVVLVGDLRLERSGDIFLVHRQDEHLVVREQVFIHRLTESEPVELGTVERLVVHRAEDRRAFGRGALGAVVIEARSCGHVEPAARLNERLVVDSDERRLVLPGERDSRGAVGLVANDQVKLGQAFLLRRCHYGD